MHSTNKHDELKTKVMILLTKQTLWGSSKMFYVIQRIGQTWLDNSQYGVIIFDKGVARAHSRQQKSARIEFQAAKPL